MKWSEQMRELLSVDENFNQLELDMYKQIITINGEFLTQPYDKQSHGESSNPEYVIPYSEYERIIEKYPFFTDVKFLLNCIFKSGIYVTKTERIEKYSKRIEIICSYLNCKLIITIAP